MVSHFYNYKTKLNVSRVEQMMLDILKLTIKCISICLDYIARIAIIDFEKHIRTFPSKSLSFLTAQSFATITMTSQWARWHLK